MSPGALARSVGASEDRFYKVLRGDRGFSDKSLALIARGLETSVAQLRGEAGVLSPDERARSLRRVRFEDFVATDPHLSQKAKDVLVWLYDQLRGR